MTTISRLPSVAEAPADPGIFSSNLAALSRRCPFLVERLMETPSREGLVLVPTEQGVPAGELDGRALCSKRRPLEEAARQAEVLDPSQAGCAVVLGFGLGYHVARLADRMDGIGVVAVYEPDVSLLRAVLERIDHSQWLARGTVAIFTDATDAPAVTHALQGWEAALAIGVQIIEHAPSRPRLGDGAAAFTGTFSQVVGTVRTHVVTTMVQMDVTIRNALMNADDYVRWAGVNDLNGIAQGRPAVVVSAGPSLHRNIEQLKTPGLRDRCIIIAVQTVLKQLLREGIRPHFVTALDYHEISKRFYEGLTAADVEGITLIAEPKANPAILAAFPGAKRLIQDEFLEVVLGDGLAGHHAPLKPGATVAHLAYYLARHLGADPVMLVGQDLAFTDGQYYAPGAAIHQVWACELNPFNTLEMMEWQRIIRMRGNLHAMTDQLGRPVYSDDQMVAYLTQFERDFMEDEQRGLVTIDATEGGVRKSHTVSMTLQEALNSYAQYAPPLPPLPVPEPLALPEAFRRRLHDTRLDIRAVARLSRETRDLLGKLAGRLSDPEKANALIRQVHALRDRVESIRPAYDLVHRLNQTGTFKRFRADRDIKLNPALNAADRQRKQVERDSMNVGWLADSADVLDDLLAATEASLDGSAPKRTRDVTPRSEDEPLRGPEKPAATVGAVITVDVNAGGTRTVLGKSAIRLTLERLARVAALRTVVIATDNAARARELVGEPIIGLDVRFVETDLTPQRERREAVMKARAWAGSSWRAGLGQLTVFDEVFEPVTMARLMDRENLDGALLVGADWCAVDPRLTALILERFAENPAVNPIAFTQAAPGLCGCVISRKLVEELALGVPEDSPLASIGGVLGFRPLNARSDPIALPCCVGVPPQVRDTPFRFIADHDGWHGVEFAATSSGLHASTAPAEAWCTIADAVALPSALRGPTELILRIAAPGRMMSPELATRLIREAVAARPSVVLTLSGSGEPGADALDHPELLAFLRAAREYRVAGVHVRTSLTISPDRLAAIAPGLVELADAISIDCIAGTPETYLAVSGRDGHGTLMSGADLLINARTSRGGLKLPWIVPRIERRDAVYEEIEHFFDKALIIAGTGVIDQLQEPIAGNRIGPLGKPLVTARRDWRSRMVVNPDGTVPADERENGARGGFDLVASTLVSVWHDLLDRREAVAASDGPGHPDLWTGW